MAIVRGPRPSDQFAQIRNDALSDGRLSFKARGLLAYLLSRPVGWETSTDRLASQGVDGRDAIRTAMWELERFGYVIRSQSRDKAGQWQHDQMVTDQPEQDNASSQVTDITAGQTRDGFSVVGAPDVGSPHVGQPGDTSKKEGSKKGVVRSSEDKSDVAVAPQTRPDVMEVLDYLDDAVAANGSKLPSRNKSNRDAARLLLDRDGRSVDQVKAAIDYATGDEFWRANILSMSKLRAKYDTLRLQAQRRQSPPDNQGDLLKQMMQRADTSTYEIGAQR